MLAGQYCRTIQIITWETVHLRYFLESCVPKYRFTIKWCWISTICNIVQNGLQKKDIKRNTFYGQNKAAYTTKFKAIKCKHYLILKSDLISRISRGNALQLSIYQHLNSLLFKTKNIILIFLRKLKAYILLILKLKYLKLFCQFHSWLDSCHVSLLIQTCPRLH